MNLQSARLRAEELREKIRYNSKLYYENDAPEISDYEYDMMFRELTELEEKSTILSAVIILSEPSSIIRLAYLPIISQTIFFVVAKPISS